MKLHSFSLSAYYTKKFIKGKIPYSLYVFLRLMVLKRFLVLLKRGKFNGLKNIEGLHEYDIPKELFNQKYRKDGISLFARLKNVDPKIFVKVVESHIPYYDEIVLGVENNETTDSLTKDLCLKLQSKYPKKIFFYEYSPEVYGVGHKKYDDTPEDSVHSLSYYCNWCLSKTTYKYVSKLDDDVLVMNGPLLEKYLNSYKENNSNYLLILPQINVYLLDGKLVTPVKYRSWFVPPISGLCCDHGIMPITEKTYFIKQKVCEIFLFNFGIRLCKPTFFHLKGLKKNFGSSNLSGKIKNEYKKMLEHTRYIKLNDELTSTLEKKLDIKF